MKLTLRLLFSILFLTSFYNYSQAIDIESFGDCSHHWRDITEEGKVIVPLPDQPKYKPEQIREIADNVLLFQKDNGGWPKNYDMLAVLTDEQRVAVLKAKSALNTTIDNGATHSHIEYLAQAYRITKEEKYKEGCVKGIEFLLRAQYKNGGWPQFYPECSGYSSHITFNDGAMTGVMNVLLDIVQKKPQYSFVDNNLSIRCKKSFDLGIDCILKCQVVENGKLLIWGQQHDEKDFKPRSARNFEPAALSNQESADIVQMLMRIKKPSAEIKKAVIAAVDWFEKMKLLNTSVMKVPANDTVYKYHRADYDRVVVTDSAAPPIWPRLSELITHRPLFCNRDKIVVYSLAEVDRERRTGYAWYTLAPTEALENFINWKKLNIGK